MNKLVATMLALVCVTLALACGGKQKAPTKDPKAEVNQRITLYNDARTKFVAQKQSLIQAEDCSRATRLRTAIDAMAEEAAMQTGDSSTITKVQMELKQAEDGCLAK